MQPTWIKRILIQLVRAQDTTNISKTSETDPKLLLQRKDKSLKKKNSIEKCMLKNKKRKTTYEIESVITKNLMSKKKLMTSQMVMEWHKKKQHQTKEKLFLMAIRKMMTMVLIQINIEKEN